MLLLEPLLVALAQLLHALQVDLVEGGEDRGGVLRLHQALGDARAQPRHRHALLGALPLGRVQRPRAGLGYRGERAELLLGLARLARVEVIHDVGLEDPPVLAAAADLARVDVELLDQAPHRGGEHRLALGRWRSLRAAAGAAAGLSTRADGAARSVSATSPITASRASACTVSPSLT